MVTIPVNLQVVDTTPPSAPTIDPVTTPTTSNSQTITGTMSEDASKVIVTCPTATVGNISYGSPDPGLILWSKMENEQDITNPSVGQPGEIQGNITFEQARFKEAVVTFVAVLSFDRDNKEVISCISDCLNRLGIAPKYKEKFLVATPKEATKLIMEVL